MVVGVPGFRDLARPHAVEAQEQIREPVLTQHLLMVGQTALAVLLRMSAPALEIVSVGSFSLSTCCVFNYFATLQTHALTHTSMPLMGMEVNVVPQHGAAAVLVHQGQ